jgi:hypothetical protein
MKRVIVLSVLSLLLLLTQSFPTPTLTHAQSPTAGLKPTFISPTPGLYVNGWPAFTVSYPKEWVEMSQMPGNVFRIGGSRSGVLPGVRLPILSASVLYSPLPLEDWAKIIMPIVQVIGTDIKVLTDKPSQLRDDTPAREVEIEYVPAYGSTPGKATDAPNRYEQTILRTGVSDYPWRSPRSCRGNSDGLRTPRRPGIRGRVPSLHCERRDHPRERPNALPTNHQRKWPMEVVRQPKVDGTKGAFMKGPTVVSLIMTGMVLMAGLSSPAGSQAPPQPTSPPSTG